MLHSVRFTHVLLLTALLVGGATAQTTAPPPSASAPAGADSPSTVLTALRSAPDWRSADLTYRAAQLTLDSARTRAGLSVSAGATGSLTKIPWDTGTWNGAATVTLSAGWSVLPWSAAQEGVRSAQRALDSAAVTLRTARATLTVQALQAYAAARSAAAQQDLTAAQVALATRQLVVAQDRRAQGVIAAEGELAAQAALEQAQVAQTRAAHAAAQAARSLARLLGRPVTLPTTSAAYAALPTVSITGTLDERIARALRSRPEVARARAALEDARAGVQAAQLDASLPDVTASAVYGQLSDAQGNPGKTVSGSVNLKAGTVGVQASVPVRDTSAVPSGLSLSLNATIPLLGSAAGTVLQQAQLGLAQAQLALDSASQAVDLDVRTRSEALEDEQAALTAAQTARAQAQAALDSTRARVDAGLATTLELGQADLALQQAAQALAAQQDAVTLAALQLALATTDLDSTLLPTGGTP
ncbi:outer membrane protein [Deinococcus metalli]|uniref:Outer membrane protein n=1 Tax=Deinococcus metalli TaxID=1141878 RepID=A0A7W8NMF9_9DEIO|nr:TolC family protein [Deinococcus metalli]MBB5375754.1 outer membrane protein [Deinococcus metalli]GHF37309.1 hypothetical protein GCM10017781_12480 [Deinococcus metalli]